MLGEAPRPAALLRVPALTDAQVLLVPGPVLPKGVDVAALLRWPTGHGKMPAAIDADAYKAAARSAEATDMESRAKAAGHACRGSRLLLAAVFGSIDLAAIPKGTGAKRFGQLHAVGNLVMIVLFAVSWFLRGGFRTTHRPPTPLSWSYSPQSLPLAPAGWGRGELVGRLGAGVDDGAGLDAPANFSTGISLKHGPRRAG